jgi:aryl-alcohol dehydrogenase-like predicted oxidoreductase
VRRDGLQRSSRIDGRDGHELMSQARIGLGCMRLSTDPARDEALATATIRAALDAGAVVLDTARAYGLDEADLGHNERLVARAVLGWAASRGRDPGRVRVVTKCGMRRRAADASVEERSGRGAGWRADGRASTVLADARDSRDALAGLAIDVLLLHAPDPRVAITTSARALARAAEEGFARSVGLSNVSRADLEEALRVAPIAAVEIALGAFDDASARDGLVRFCAERGIEVFAHSPLGGPRRAPKLASDARLRAIAADLGVSPAEMTLAYLVALYPNIVPLAGARRPATAASAISASRIALDTATLARLDERFPGLAALRRPAPRPPAHAKAEVVMLMGIAGAGKSRAAASFVARGYERLNRDESAGTLRHLAHKLEERLAAGAERVVLDNTYLTRASRSDVILAALRHGAKVVCRHVDVPIHEAQVNVVLRMLERYGELLEPDAIARGAKTNPNLINPERGFGGRAPIVITPSAQFRMLRELVPPSLDEGFAECDVVRFERAPRPGATAAGAVVALDAVADDAAGDLRPRDDAALLLARLPEGAPCLLLAWRPGADAAWRERAAAVAKDLAERSGRGVELGVCAHAEGPPVCWCRPPLPGLWLAFAERRSLDPRKSVLVGTGAAHATMARALGLALTDVRS